MNTNSLNFISTLFALLFIAMIIRRRKIKSQIKVEFVQWRNGAVAAASSEGAPIVRTWGPS